MTRDEAVLLLKCHAFAFDDVHHPKMEHGFLGSLRPFRGTLLEENFHEMMEILRVLSLDLSQPTVDREIMSCLWSIVHLGRAWVLEPEGMLRRNGLISQKQIDQMDQWLGMLSYAIMILLEDGGEKEAFWEYREYVRENAAEE